jgi:hypothetical protein
MVSYCSICSYSQDCSNFENLANCEVKIIKNYAIYLQHKNTAINVNDTLIYEIPFFGNSDYILSFCANRNYYPLNIKLLQSVSKQELYNNSFDNFNESISMTLYNTQNIILEVILMADKIGKNRIKIEDKVCIGLDMQCKKIFPDLN